ncbi:MAG: GFA family protein [Pseudomonadota bacterium]
MSGEGLVTITGGCHCGAVRFRAEADAEPKMLRCNCSICAASGYLHLFIPHERFELFADDDALASYRFGSGEAEHLFCSTCGIKSFYQPKSHPDCWSVHLACLDEPHGLHPEISDFDGKNWAEAITSVCD